MKNMSKPKKIIAIVLCVCVLFGVLVPGGGIRALATALNQAIRGNEVTASSYYKTNPQAKLGSEENPLIVLEIVPSDDQAAWGYYFPGCEPVDMEKGQMLYSKYNIKKPLADENAIFSTKDSEEFAFYDQIQEGDFVLEGKDGISLKDVYQDYESRGFNLDKEATDKDYGQWQIQKNKDYSEKGIYKRTGADQGKFRLEGDKYIYDSSEAGTYIWIPEDKISEEDSGEPVVTRKDEYVFRRKYLQMMNNDSILSMMYNANSSNFSTKVVTVTPQQLQATATDGNIPLINEADLITIHNLQDKDLVSAYDFMYPQAANGATAFNTSDNDLTYDETMAILKRMASGNPAAMVIQKPLVWEPEVKDNIKVEQSNFHKLLIMLLQYQPMKFMDTFGNYLTSQDINGYEKVVYRPGYDSGDVTEFTNTTFAVSPSDKGKSMYSEMRLLNVNGGGTDIVDRIMTTQKDPVVSELLNDKKDITYSAFDPNNKNGDKSENTTSAAFEYFSRGTKDKISQLEGLEYILQPQQYTPQIRILEVQPCDQFIYKQDDNWKEYYQSLLSWYNPGTDNAEGWLLDENLLQVTTMPTWEFNGSAGRYDYNAKDAEGNPVPLTTDSSDDILARYDMIIFGSKQDESNGLKGYNEYTNKDTPANTGAKLDLEHLIYTAIGGTPYNGSRTWNLENNQQDEAMDLRYSGNDITLKKMLEVEDFLKAGKPVVIDNNLYTKDGKVDTDKVDKDSKFYDLLTWKDKEKITKVNDEGKTVEADRNAHENLFVYGNIDSTKMKNLINGNLCRLTFCDDEDAYPLEYDYTTEDKNGVKGVIRDEIYQSKDADGKAVLVFHFYVAGTSAQGYKAALNIDVDGDGVYSGSLKEISEVDNMNAAMGTDEYIYDSSEEPMSLKFYATKSEMRRDNRLGTSDTFVLQPYTPYYATVDIPKERQGIIPWKLEVQEVENQYLRSSAVDYTAVINEDKDTISVLQMNLMGNMQNNGPIDQNLWSDKASYTAFTKESIVVKTGENYEQFRVRRDANGGIAETDDRLWNDLSANQRISPEKFETYLAPVKEFDVHIQYMYNKDWYQLFGTPNKGENGYDKQKFEDALENWKDFLSHYDMVVFGFTDQNSFTENGVYVEGIKDFIEQGKGMILSHDTVTDSHMLEYNKDNAGYLSAENITKLNETYGKYNTWLRTTAGLRRSYYNRKNDGTYEKSYNHVQSNGQDVTFVSKENLEDKGGRRKYLGQLTEEIDGGSVEPEFYGTYVNEFMNNDVFLYVRASQRHPNDAKNGNFVKDRVVKGGPAWDGWQQYLIYDTTMVKLTNNGQITTYPYKLNSVIEVMQTHVQNFQLDMEFQQEGDVNVWFTLSDSYDDEVQNFYGGSKNKVPNTTNPDNNIYSAKDQDAQNQFYIYNKGNITYTGSGHGVDRGRGQVNSVMTDDEVKLFVNTMIAAYRPPDSKPYVDVENADSVSVDNNNIIYVDYDSGNKDAAVDGKLETIDGEEMVRVEISVNDIKSAMATNIKGKQYFLDVKSADTDVPSNYMLCDMEGNRLTRNDSGKGKDRYSVNASLDGERYILYVPYKDVRDNTTLSVVFEVSAVYTKGGREMKTSTQKTLATVMLLPLYDLR